MEPTREKMIDQRTSKTVAALVFVICTLVLICWQAVAEAESRTEPLVSTTVATSLVPKLDDGRLFSDLSDEDVAKLPLLGRLRFKQWRLTKLDIEAEERKAIIAQKEKEAVERKAIIAQKEKETLQNVTTKWKDVSAQLQVMQQDKVIAHLKSDLEPYRRLLAYVVANKIEPLEYAKTLLAALNEKSKKE